MNAATITAQDITAGMTVRDHYTGDEFTVATVEQRTETSSVYLVTVAGSRGGYAAGDLFDVVISTDEADPFGDPDAELNEMKRQAQLASGMQEPTVEELRETMLRDEAHRNAVVRNGGTVAERLAADKAARASVARYAGSAAVEAAGRALEAAGRELNHAAEALVEAGEDPSGTHLALREVARELAHLRG